MRPRLGKDAGPDRTVTAQDGPCKAVSRFHDEVISSIPFARSRQLPRLSLPKADLKQPSGSPPLPGPRAEGHWQDRRVPLLPAPGPWPARAPAASFPSRQPVVPASGAAPSGVQRRGRQGLLRPAAGGCRRGCARRSPATCGGCGSPSARTRPGTDACPACASAPCLSVPCARRAARGGRRCGAPPRPRPPAAPAGRRQ